MATISTYVSCGDEFDLREASLLVDDTSRCLSCHFPALFPHDTSEAPHVVDHAELAAQPKEAWRDTGSTALCTVAVAVMGVIWFAFRGDGPLSLLWMAAFVTGAVCLLWDWTTVVRRWVRLRRGTPERHSGRHAVTQDDATWLEPWS